MHGIHGVTRMLVVDELTCRFGSKTAVDRASFSIERGSFIGVIGRSGAGKSTLLRMINRLVEPSEGRVLFEGVDVTALKGAALREWRARSAMIFQQFNLVGRLDVLTNVLMGRLATVPTWRSLVRLWPDNDSAIAMSALEQFDMAQIASQRADNSPAASSSASRSPARWCRSRTSCSPTSRSPRSIRATPGSSWMRCCASTGTSASR